MGYAIASSTPVIFVDEKRSRHTEWLGVHCTNNVDSIDEGLDLLREMFNLTQQIEVGATDDGTAGVWGMSGSPLRASVVEINITRSTIDRKQ
jgi:L-fucose isomerase-like protein